MKPGRRGAFINAPTAECIPDSPIARARFFIVQKESWRRAQNAALESLNAAAKVRPADAAFPYQLLCASKGFPSASGGPVGPSNCLFRQRSRPASSASLVYASGIRGKQLSRSICFYALRHRFQQRSGVPAQPQRSR
jgi:hypothetical protein